MFAKEIPILFILTFISMLTLYISNELIAPIATIIAIPILFYYKRYIFIVFILFSYFRFQEMFYIIEPLKLPKLLAILSITLIAIDVLLKESIKFKIDKYNIIIFLIAFFMPLNILMSTMTVDSFYYFTSVYIKVLLMSLILSLSLQKEFDFKVLLIGIVISGLLVSIVALYNKFNGIGLVEGTRVTIARDKGSILGDPNDLALIILFPLSFTLAYFQEIKNNLYKIIIFFVVVSIVAAILATQSRGGLLGVITIFFIYIKNKIKSKALIFSICSIGLIGLYFLSGIDERSTMIDRNESIDQSAQSRLSSWETAIKMGLSNILTGVGIHGFKYNYFYYTDNWTGFAYDTHSTWLKAFAEGGMFFAFLFFYLIYSIYKMQNAIKQKVTLLENTTFRCMYNAVSLSFYGFIVSSTFLTQTYNWPIYIIWAITYALLKYSEKKMI